jgi:hypothetical protein
LLIKILGGGRRKEEGRKKEGRRKEEGRKKEGRRKEEGRKKEGRRKEEGRKECGKGKATLKSRKYVFKGSFRIDQRVLLGGSVNEGADDLTERTSSGVLVARRDG